MGGWPIPFGLLEGYRRDRLQLVDGTSYARTRDGAARTITTTDMQCFRVFVFVFLSRRRGAS